MKKWFTHKQKASQQTSQTRTAEKGQGFVEFSMLVVLMMIMLAGVVDLGRMFLFYLQMRDAAQEGSSYGTAYPTFCLQIEDRVTSNLPQGSNVDIEIFMNGKPCTTASPTADACGGKEVMVRISDDEFPITMPFLGTFLGRQSVPLSARISGTILRPQCQ